MPNIKIKDKAEAKTKIEEKKKELPPLLEIKTQDNLESKKNKPFKMDPSFLKND